MTRSTTGSGVKAFAPDAYNTPNQSQMKKLSNAAEMGDKIRGASKMGLDPASPENFRHSSLYAAFWRDTRFSIPMPRRKATFWV